MCRMVNLPCRPYCFWHPSSLFRAIHPPNPPIHLVYVSYNNSNCKCLSYAHDPLTLTFQAPIHQSVITLQSPHFNIPSIHPSINPLSPYVHLLLCGVHVVTVLNKFFCPRGEQSLALRLAIQIIYLVLLAIIPNSSLNCLLACACAR